MQVAAWHENKAGYVTFVKYISTENMQTTLNVPDKLVNKLLVLYGTQVSLLCPQEPTNCPYPEPVELGSHSYPVALKFILLLSSHLCPCPPSGLYPLGLLTKTLHIFLFYPICAACPAHLILLHLITQIIFGEKYKS
jgi:hypothetical protein